MLSNFHFFTLWCLVGFEHSSFVFAQEANMHENRFNEYRIPSGMLIVFLEKALTLIHMETHLDDVSRSDRLETVTMRSILSHFATTLSPPSETSKLNFPG